MADIFNIGTSALLSLQQAINTTGHNIANVNTEGYSRQRVDLSTLPPQFGEGAYVGSGVAADSITRIFDQFLVDDVRVRTSAQSGSQVYYDLASRLDGLLADPNAGLSPVLSNFFNALQDVADNPSSLPERQALLGEAQQLADRFHFLSGSLRSVNDEINARLETTVSEVNSLAQGIASLNEQIVSLTAAGSGAPPNDLLDTRDQLLNDLASLVGVSTTNQSDGSVNVTIGNGQTLVVGAQAEQLQTFSSPFDGNQLLVGKATPAGTFDDLSRFLGGGELGAVLDFRNEVLNPAINQLGLVAQGLTATVNEQHRLGVDLNGLAGGDFFQPLGATATPNSNNAGASTVNVSITDATQLTVADYSLRFDGAQWTLTNLTDQTTQTGAGPFTVDGLDISIAGVPANGDTFLVQPTREASTLFGVALSGPENFAAAAPVRSTVSLSNTGSGDIDGVQVTDTAGLPLAGPITLTFNPDALGAGVPGYDVVGIAGGPLAFDPATDSNGQTFVLGDIEFSLNGVPQAGDQIVIENNVGGTGDNRNVLQLAGFQTDQQLLGGSASYQDVYNNLIADVGVKTRQAESSANTGQILLDQAVNARESVSGVNLDEEAANLIRFQQAYQAAAQIISVADELFQTLLNATRR